MRLGGGGCQGDRSFQEPRVLAIGGLEEVSCAGLYLRASSSRGSQNVLLLEQESEFPGVLPRSSSGLSTCGRFPHPAGKAMSGDPGFDIPPLTFLHGPASNLRLMVSQTQIVLGGDSSPLA